MGARLGRGAVAPGGHLALHWGLAGSTLPSRPPHSIRAPGRLINTIRVVCASYEDYSHWLLCLQTVCREDRASPPPGPESLPGLRASTQVRSQQGRCCQAAVKQTGVPGHREVGRVPATWLTFTPCRLPRLWSVAEARSPLMHGPAGTQGARRPPPLAPATPSLSPQHHPLQAAQPGPHQ